MAAGLYFLQGGSGQQGLISVQLHLYAGLKGLTFFPINRHSVLQVAAESMSNTNSPQCYCLVQRQLSDWQHDSQH